MRLVTQLVESRGGNRVVKGSIPFGCNAVAAQIDIRSCENGLPLRLYTSFQKLNRNRHAQDLSFKLMECTHKTNYAEGLRVNRALRDMALGLWELTQGRLFHIHLNSA